MAARKGQKPTWPRPPALVKGKKWLALRRELLAAEPEVSLFRCELVDRLVVNLSQADAALREAVKMPFTEGSRGQEVAHPGFAVAARCEMSALALAKQLEAAGGEGEEAVRDTVRDELAEIRARKAGAA